MKRTPIALLTCALVAFAAATSSGAEQPADRVLTGGNIETMNPNQPNVQAVAMKGGKIVFVGSDEDAKKYIGDKTDVIDLNGEYVTPGLIESHNHVIASTWMTTGVDLSSAKSGEDVGQLETMMESLRTGGTFHCGNCKRVFKELEMLEQRFKKLEQEKE